MRFMLTFYADAGDWMALPEGEREAAIDEIGGVRASCGSQYDVEKWRLRP